MNKKIIFFDIDRTLYNPFTKQIPSSTKKALSILHEKEDIEIAIATGRADYMLHVIEDINQYINIFILINGQIIIKDGQTIYRNPMPYEKVKEVVKVFEEHQMKYGFLGEFNETLNIVDEKAKKAFELVDMKLPSIDKDFYKKNDVFQMWAFCEKNRQAYFESKFPTLQLVSWLGDGFDILSKQTSKKEGIIRILSLEGIPLSNAYAIGDGDNDIEMLDFIPNSVAMKNGSCLAKKHAKFITEDIENDGVYIALQKLGLL